MLDAQHMPPMIGGREICEDKFNDYLLTAIYLWLLYYYLCFLLIDYLLTAIIN